jgi:hypothetical protein
MTDNGLAALAAALHLVYCRGNAPMHSAPDHSAAAILGPRGVFLPNGDCGHVGWPGVTFLQDQAATIAALRADLDSESMERADAERTIATLRAALDGLVKASEWLSASAPSKPTAFQAKVTASRLADFRAALARAKEAGK